ncbi:hypothetical protein LTS00_018117, partial [Friedmanniomyces endolithicus]
MFKTRIQTSRKHLLDDYTKFRRGRLRLDARLMRKLHPYVASRQESFADQYDVHIVHGAESLYTFQKPRLIPLSFSASKLSLFSVIMAHPDAVQDKQTLSLTFKAPKRELSNITITIESNTDPVKIGQHLTFPDHEATSDFLGFPTCTAKICSPNSKGYAAIYGWIQMWRFSVLPDPILAVPWDMDEVPTFTGLNTPFCWFGPEPQLFNAPSRWAQDREMDWSALSFLTYVEDALLSKKVRPVLAFEWGFWIKDRVKSVKPVVLREVGEAWEEQRGLLEGKFEGWVFGDVEEGVE